MANKASQNYRPKYEKFGQKFNLKMFWNISRYSVKAFNAKKPDFVKLSSKGKNYKTPFYKKFRCKPNYSKFVAKFEKQN